MHRANARAREHADHRLWHHWHVENDAITFSDPEIAQDGSENLRLDLQAVIGDRELLPSERRIVDDRGLLAAPGENVAVDRVPAGVADAVREPAAVHAGLGIEHLLGPLDPVDVGRRFAPKSLRVALRARIDLLVAARSRIHDLLPYLEPFWSLVPSRVRAIVSAPGKFASRVGRARIPCGNASAPGQRHSRGDLTRRLAH